ncbi:hypothetical protein [Xanthomonas cannabis]|uniref:hypothetical protein n=1 Tax=Xanthomonas cannabis TaxID=1885674 RepID=UPI003CCE9343
MERARSSSATRNEMVYADSHEAIDEAEYLSAKLEHLVREFEQALAAHQIELPYAPSLAGYQFIQAAAAQCTFAGGEPARADPHTTRGPRDTLTAAILAKTEHQVTHPTLA